MEFNPECGELNVFAFDLPTLQTSLDCSVNPQQMLGPPQGEWELPLAAATFVFPSYWFSVPPLKKLKEILAFASSSSTSTTKPIKHQFGMKDQTVSGERRTTRTKAYDWPFFPKHFPL